MKKVTASVCTVATKRQSVKVSETEIASLFSDLSSLYDNTFLLSERLNNEGQRRSSAEIFEVVVMLKSALRMLADAASHLK